jgi:FHA domain-containing protein
VRVDLELLGKDRRWNFDQPRVVLGREPHCDVTLQSSEFPSVSREHVALTVRDNLLIAEDLHSSNGTLLNGAPLHQPQPLRPGDVLRLGPDGPSLRVQFAMVQAVAGDAPTMLEKSAGRGQAATRMAQVNDYPPPGNEAATRMASASERPAPAAAGNEAATRFASANDIAQQPHARKFGVAPAKPAAQAAAPAPAMQRPAATPQAISSGDEAMLEQKLNSIRTISLLMLIVLVVMLGVIFYQSQQLDKNRAEIQQLRADAQNSIANFTPQLEQRLNKMDQRVDGMDAKMQAAEDHMVKRMNDELPRMLDKYVDRKMQQMQNDPNLRNYGVK